mmetsp:Transcript_22821/g.41258  ORF Transcript_22821/g.41258 Transcript_22821/m.41258 type:complete len:192 (-) Transcript_22821:119-694(-)|eukprot:CAMPEP_0198282010 /NCGR_PEP_ID=MMETSP1449-20131203/1889_1 /TAXON_ID=420275 /ORGANISM="Attheya septentrionalis, Strain CCMP2084" /LENGTH=191 /DNA_ID=CAMNT_0043978077 /DNA_START=81 /DNA_END=656 /DNA_ORIENTATION=-
MSDVVLTRLEDEESCVQVIPFGVSSSLPKKMMSTEDAFDSMSLTANNTGRGVVGTVTLLGKSAMVWVGWGSLEESDNSADTNSSSPVTPGTLGKGMPLMGSLAVSMPRTRYAGLSDGDAACTQLIGGESEEDQMMGWQMATRLSKRTGWPVFVSCSLSSVGNNNNQLEGGLSSHQVAALAEKEIGRILRSK